MFSAESIRKDAAGRFAWPGFGENIRVLKWIIQRLAGQAEHISEFFRTFHRHLPDRLWELHRELAGRLEAASSAGRQGHRG